MHETGHVYPKWWAATLKLRSSSKVVFSAANLVRRSIFVEETLLAREGDFSASLVSV